MYVKLLWSLKLFKLIKKIFHVGAGCSAGCERGVSADAFLRHTSLRGYLRVVSLDLSSIVSNLMLG